MVGMGLTFVVGTGRCGSTALSGVLRGHPEVLSVSELISSAEPGALPEGPLTGEEFWKLLSSPRPFADRMIREGTPVPEHTYAQNPGRFDADEGIPAICLATLPHLTDDPDAAFDALAPELSARPEGSAGGHYRALFQLLSERFGGKVAVERSGFSLRSVPRLREVFPEARFVHLYRGGPDCALSMSRHPAFRLVRLMADAAEGGAGDEELPGDLEQLLADEKFDLRSALERPVPADRFGRMWSEMVVDGVERLAELPGELRMSLSYEDLLEEPKAELTRLVRFLGVEEDPEWMESAVAELDGGRRGAAESLPEEELAALRESCAPGEAVLAEAKAKERVKVPGKRAGR